MNVRAGSLLACYRREGDKKIVTSYGIVGRIERRWNGQGFDAKIFWSAWGMVDDIARAYPGGPSFETLETMLEREAWRVMVY